MKLHRSMKQFIVFLLAFLMAFEPFAVNMVYANSGPDSDTNAEIVAPDADLETLEGNSDSEGVADNLDKMLENSGDDNDPATMKPAEYLEYMYKLRGRSKTTTSEDARKIEKALAWGEWMNTISGSYAMMDDGCNDVFTFYNTLGEFVRQGNNAPQYLEALTWATNKAALVGSFIAKITGLSKVGTKFSTWVKTKANLMKGLNAVNKFYTKGLNSATNFLSHMSPPVAWCKGTGEGTVSYWRWVARRTGLESNAKYLAGVKKINEHLPEGYKAINTNKGAAVISNSKGIATTIGIGLTVIGIAFDAYDLFG
ncbi:MAG: hypothetical protein J6Z11_09390, partial [Candidatus Riflebacteria bacterium]|nr:hypothetical protein [Candidatus Riflebacteria bacterium]